MSKRFALPNQKGTELWPQVTQAPTKLVVHGVEGGSALERVVAERFGGRLKQFHAKQQQMYSLSGADQHSKRIRFVGATAEYTNIRGQETLTLVVDIPVLEELSKEKPKRVADFAVIDLVVPDSVEVDCQFTAVVIPLSDKTYTTDWYGTIYQNQEFDYQYLAFDASNVYDEGGTIIDDVFIVADPPFDRPIIRYCDWADATTSVAISNRVSSLLIDFRDLSEHAVVNIDLYGNVYGDADVGPPDIFLGYREIIPYLEIPGPLLLSLVPEVPNPACTIQTIHYRVFSSPIFGAPSPNPLYVWPSGSGDFDAFFAYMVSLSSNNDYGEYIDYQGQLNTEFTDQVAVSPGQNEIALRDTDGGDEPYFTMGYDWVQEYDMMVQANTIHRTKEPVYGPDPNWEEPDYTVSRTADLTYAFYYAGTRFTPALLAGHDYNAAIWLTKPDGLPPTDRHKFSSVFLDDRTDGETTPANPGSYIYRGRLTVGRDLNARFTPA